MGESTYGLIVRRLRNKLSALRAKKLVFVHYNKRVAHSQGESLSPTRTSVVFVQETRHVERDEEFFTNYGTGFRFSHGRECHLCRSQHGHAHGCMPRPQNYAHAQKHRCVNYQKWYENLTKGKFKVNGVNELLWYITYRVGMNT
jgi:hypothetical protein